MIITKELLPSQIQFYQENGYLLIPKYATTENIQILRAAAQQLVAEFDLSYRSIFTTENQQRHSDRYFLESGDQVRCFFEEEAFDNEGNLSVEKSQAINKIGHAMHDLLPVFRRFSYQAFLFSIAKALGMQCPAIAQSQYIFKQAKIGGVVNPHTDSTFIYTTPLSCLGAWFALEDADEENGCLTVLPKSHLDYPLQEQFVRNETESGTIFVDTSEARCTWNTGEMIPLPAKQGDLILLHGSLVHGSHANRSSRSRHAYVLHLIDLACEWSSRNWLQRSPSLPFREMKSVVQ